MASNKVFGIDISGIDGERLAFKFAKKWLEPERALMGGKWFDYRFMNPTAATYLFAHEYTKAYQKSYKRNISTERGGWTKPLPEDLFTASKAIIIWIWRARQVADAMCMPYDAYLERAFHWRTRYSNQSTLPRPQHIYSDLITDRATIDWEEMRAAKLYHGKDLRYRAPFFDPRSVAQVAHHDYLFEQAARRGNNPLTLAYILDEELLSPQMVRHRLGALICSEALALCKHATL